MAKTAVSQWDTTANNNTDINGISLAENVMQPPAVNDALREMMAQIKAGVFLQIAATSSVAAGFQLAEATSNGTNKVTVSAPTSLSADRTVTFPDASGTVLLADTAQTVSGVLTFSAAPVLSSGVELGANDTTLSRAAAGVLAVEGNVVPSPGSQATGDVLYRGASSWDRLAKGTDGQVLTLASGLPSWAAAPSSGQPVPSSATYAVGTMSVLQNKSAGTISAGASTAGSNLQGFNMNATPAYATGGAQSGTWLNITGAQVGINGAGLFVRTA